MWFLCILTAHAADIAGTYTLLSTPAEVKTSINAGVEASTKDVSPMFKGKARKRLEKIPEICDRYTFQLNDDALSWQCDGKSTLVIPRSSFGASVRMQVDGKSVLATVSVDENTVQARFEGDDGQRTTVFAFSDDGLVSQSAVTGTQLTVPFRWEVKYTRAAATP